MCRNCLSVKKMVVYMRAVIELNAQKGPGYGQITIYDIGDTGAPEFALRRVADGMTLAEGGWRDGMNALAPEQWDYADGHLRLFLSPAVVDNLSSGDDYEFELIGTGSCPLEWGEIIQSTVVDANGIDEYAPPPERPEMPPLDPQPMGRVDEGVERTPIVAPAGDDGNMPSGVAAAPDAQPAKQPKKGKGCLFASIGLFTLWLGGGWFLWHGSMNAPVRGDEESATFEIIPRSTEKSYVETDGEQMESGAEEGSSSGKP